MREDRTAQMIGQTIQRVGEETPDSLDEKPQYQIQTLLGKQPGRRTFLAIASDTQQPVVVKLLLFGPDFTWEDLKLFEREAETLKSLDHPAIPQYLDSFETDTLLGEGFVLVQTYIEAKSLQAVAAAGRRFSEDDLKALAESLLKILQYLHSRFPTVIHRDIKPSNILLSDRTAHSIGKVYLVDFGSVQTVAHGGTMTVVGTYGYMPPEQFGGRAVPASDLYSLGKTLTYLAIGTHPADELSLPSDRSPSRRVSFTAGFDQWIARLTRSDLAERTATATDALQQLENLSGNVFSAIEKPAANKAELASRPNRSAFPLAPVYDDFVVFSTPYEMEIQFPPSRVKGKLKTSQRKSTSSMAAVWWAVGSSLLAVLLIGEAGAVLLVAAVLFFFFPRKKKSRKSKSIQPVSLKLWYPFNGLMLMSLNTASRSQRSLSTTSDELNRSKDFSYLTLTSIKAKFQPSEEGALLNFFFNDESGDGRLCIRGKTEEVRWLCEHLSQWRDVPVEGYE